MNKALIGLSFFVVLTLISVYIFIPAQLHISVSTAMNTNTNALFRYVSDESKWNQWWPLETNEIKLIDEDHYKHFNGYTYRLKEKLYNAVGVEIIKKNQVIAGKIIIIPIAQDSLIVQWNNNLTTSINPFIRIKQYQQALNTKKNITVILHSLKSFAEDKDKVYKLNIRRTTLTDTLFVAVKTVTTGYPSTEVIYHFIQNLRTYITQQKAREMDRPILNITKRDSVHYEMMVAIATNIALKGNGSIAFKRMIAYKDKILTADVTGGLNSIKKAYNELNTYMSDYNLTSPVIHWETLITDRSKETDSTKWITRICIPIV
ncbi:hypothetical protein [Segetibacter koreensis]|uniref:hypothetical protein n=1 Tax=Segetibacter koreensis TaxID=398037 RepID=UPI000378D430|nr:hypothetical protein [Segetibacter koreensis]